MFAILLIVVLAKATNSDLQCNFCSLYETFIFTDSFPAIVELQCCSFGLWPPPG